MYSPSYAAALYKLDRLPSDRLPDLAIAWLGQDIESKSVLLLAGELASSAPTELRQLFEQSLAELAVPVPDVAQAALVYRDSVAADVAHGRVPPREAARELVQLYYQVEGEFPDNGYVGSGMGLSKVIGLYYSLDDLWNLSSQKRADAEAQIDADLVAACASLAERS